MILAGPATGQVRKPVPPSLNRVLTILRAFEPHTYSYAITLGTRRQRLSQLPAAAQKQITAVLDLTSSSGATAPAGRVLAELKRAVAVDSAGHEDDSGIWRRHFRVEKRLDVLRQSFNKYKGDDVFLVTRNLSLYHQAARGVVLLGPSQHSLMTYDLRSLVNPLPIAPRLLSRFSSGHIHSLGTIGSGADFCHRFRLFSDQADDAGRTRIYLDTDHVGLPIGVLVTGPGVVIVKVFEYKPVGGSEGKCVLVGVNSAELFGDRLELATARLQQSALQSLQRLALARVPAPVARRTRNQENQVSGDGVALQRSRSPRAAFATLALPFLFGLIVAYVQQRIMVPLEARGEASWSAASVAASVDLGTIIAAKPATGTLVFRSIPDGAKVETCRTSCGCLVVLKTRKPTPESFAVDFRLEPSTLGGRTVQSVFVTLLPGPIRLIGNVTATVVGAAHVLPPVVDVSLPREKTRFESSVQLAIPTSDEITDIKITRDGGLEVNLVRREAGPRTVRYTFEIVGNLPLRVEEIRAQVEFAATGRSGTRMLRVPVRVWRKKKYYLSPRLLICQAGLAAREFTLMLQKRAVFQAA